MEVFRTVDEHASQRIWDGVTGRAVHGKQLTLAVIELAPDTVIPEHSHVNEQVGLLVEGSLSFRAGDETRELAQGATWCIPAHVPHEVRVGDEGAVVVEAFSPARDDWRTLAELEPSKSRWP